MTKTGSFLLSALVLAAAAPAAIAQDKGGPRAPAAPTATAGALSTEALESKFAALTRDATALVAEYRKAINAKAEALAQASPTLGRLREAGLFTGESVIAGVSLDDPLAALPDLRRRFEHLPETAKDLEKDFASSARDWNAQAAVGLLKKIATAQNLYREEDRDGNGILDYADSLPQLGAAGFTMPGTKLQTVTTVGGYRFRVLHGDPLRWAAEAVPEKPGETGDTFLYLDERGIVRAARGTPANPSSEPLK